MSPAWDCRGLLGQDEGTLQERLGAPTTRRALGADLWLVFQEPGRVLRARLSNPAGSDAGPRLASWSATFADGFPTLREIAAATGLWPIVEPDVRASRVEGPLVRRALPDPECSPTTTHSLTASVRGGRFVRIAAFDEPPDWL